MKSRNTKEMTAAINHVAKATSQTKEQVMAKLFDKDQWAWFLIGEAEKALNS